MTTVLDVLPTILELAKIQHNLGTDPGEQLDLAKQEPDRLMTLIAQWESYVKETGVIVPNYEVGYAH